MIKLRWSLAAMGLLAIVILATTPMTVLAAQLDVPDRYSTIQEAVDAASDGATIVVKAGSYDGFTVQGKRLTVQAFGDGAVVLTGKLAVGTRFEGRTSTIVFLKDAQVVMQGLTLQNTWDEIEAAHYGVIAQESDLEFIEGALRDFPSAGAKYGIIAWSEPGGEKPTLKVVRGLTPRGHYANSPIRVVGDVEAQILDNQFVEFCHGIYIGDQASALIQGNTIGTPQDVSCSAVNVFTDGQVTIKDNTITTMHDGGITVGGNGQVEITNNTIRDVNYAAIKLSGGPKLKVTVSGNTIEDSSVGIFLKWTAREAQVTITGNRIRGNGAGIYAWGGEAQIQITENDIRENGAGIYARDDARLAVHQNNIVGNYRGIDSTKAQGTVDATLNWWGDPSGPSGDFAGSGDAAVGRVKCDPWLTAPVQI